MLSYQPLDEEQRPLPDKRLIDRLENLVDCFANKPDSSIPEATGNRNDMDGAYNLFKNERVNPGGVVTSSLPNTLGNLEGCLRILSLQDTTDLNYNSLKKTTGLGYTDGHDTRGFKLHSSLAVDALTGLPLGILTQQFWQRLFQDKGIADKRRNREAEDKESFRWQDHACLVRSLVPADIVVVHVADREGDIYNWFADERPANTHLLVRVAQAHRIAISSNGEKGKLSAILGKQPILGQHQITVPRKDDLPSRKATLSIRVAEVDIQPPRNAKNRSQLKAVRAWVIQAKEENPPAGSQAICWRLVTTEKIETLEEALRAVGEYLFRWLIERFHFTLKSGFKVEKLQLETADQLANAVAVYSQAAVRLMRLNYLARRKPDTPASQEFSQEELDVLQDERDQRAKKSLGPIRTISEAIRVVAQLGGFLARKGDGHPGLKVLWRGLKALHHACRAIRNRFRNIAPRNSAISS